MNVKNVIKLLVVLWLSKLGKDSCWRETLCMYAVWENLYLFHLSKRTCTSSHWRKTIYTSNAGNPSRERIDTREKPFVCKHWQTPSFVPVLSEYMKQTTMERNLTCVSYVGKLSESREECWGMEIQWGQTVYEECGRVFKSFGYLQNHIRTHAHQKP